MPTPALVKNVFKLLKSNAPEILTALGVTGVVTTSYLASRASFKASEIIKKEEDEGRAIAGPSKHQVKEYGKLVWKCYIPPVVSGTVTAACIIGASKASNNRTAAAVTAYSLTQKAFGEYREKVVEQLNQNKERTLRDGIAQDTISKNPSGSREVIITGKGQHLCCELMTRRYFRSDMESLMKARNDINHMINNNYYVSLSEFYDIIGLPYTSVSSNLGWDSDKLLELEITTTVAENGDPCLAFDYNYTKPLR